MTKLKRTKLGREIRFSRTIRVIRLLGLLGRSGYKGYLIGLLGNYTHTILFLSSSSSLLLPPQRPTLGYSEIRVNKLIRESYSYRIMSSSPLLRPMNFALFSLSLAPDLAQVSTRFNLPYI